MDQDAWEETVSWSHRTDLTAARTAERRINQLILMLQSEDYHTYYLHSRNM